MNVSFLPFTKKITFLYLALTAFNLNLAAVSGNSESSSSRKLGRDGINRIINGEFVDANTYPWFTDINGCGGFLIAKDFVLTAAHCTYGQTVSSARVGALSYSKANNGGQFTELFGVSSVVEHPQYDDYALENDSALIKLSGTSTIQPVMIDGIDAISEQYNGEQKYIL